MMEAFIITGASKGIGLELCRQLAGKGAFVIGIARTAEENWPGTVFFPFDLTKTDNIAELMAAVSQALPAEISALTLINNAGTIEPIGFAENNELEAIAASISLNLTAPMLLCSAFLQAFKGNDAVKSIVNISSGAGRHTYKGWSAYCAGKAGLDHFSACLDEENDQVKVVSVAPGIIDTDMQSRIRSSSESDFPLLERFQDYKDSGKLSSAKATAFHLIEMMERRDFRTLPTILDLRNLPSMPQERNITE
ncbi:SDR family NAD(P)-dependent oxidoreductase [Planococcus sp. YIM B11945]|uniref:SDR family NAD(P)-dependent oxidoreductase n=1 Tax=Planococcus sp. YIM B11945 TaxID=3435410 RepID=UPI003D7D291C